MNTLIEKVLENPSAEKPKDFIFDETQLSKYILDLSLNQDIRIRSLEMYYKTHKEETIELVSRLTGMYQFSGTKTIQQFLIYACSNDIKLSSFLQLECAKSLLSFFEFEEDILKDDEPDMVEIKNESNTLVRERNLVRKNIGYKALNNVCKIIINDSDFPTPCKIDAVCMLMETDDYKKEVDTYFRDIINDSKLDCDYRYKTILSLEKRNGISSTDCKLLNTKFYMTNACSDFLNNSINKTMYRILSGQYLLQHCELEDMDKNNIYDVLYGFSTDDQLDYNLRADAADTLLSLGSDDYKVKAREIIMVLGRIEGVVRNVYDNAQNVHTKDIEKSVGDILEFLLTYKTMVVGENPIDFAFVSNKINNILKDELPEGGVEDETLNICQNCKKECEDKFCSTKCEIMFEKHKKVKISLNRIEIDRTLYSKYSSNLSNILVKLWSYIQENEFCDAMTGRLVEELEDMSGTCSTGFLSRLVNTLSGFGQLSIKISFEDQIISNFTGRLNMYARKITAIDSPFRKEKLYDIAELYVYCKGLLCKYPTMKTMKSLLDEYLKTDRDNKINEILEDFEEEVINEMMLETTKFKDRRHFLMFFRVYMLKIREELYEEFKDFITDTEFDLCIRKAISSYEGVQHMV